MKIFFYLIYLNFDLRKKLEACKSEAPFKIDRSFKTFAVHKYLSKNITPCKSFEGQNIAVQKSLLVQKSSRVKMSPRLKVTLRAKVSLNAKDFKY